MRRRKQYEKPHHERWLVSYADFITLLFAFFVVLYATAKADQYKQEQVAQSIDTAFKSLGLFQSSDAKPSDLTKAALAQSQEDAVSPVNVVLGDQLMAPPEVQQDFQRIKKNLEGLLSNQIAQHIVALNIGRDGLVISLREAGFYDSGSASPHPGSIKTLDQIAAALRQTPYAIRIEGHTDNVPIHTAQFDSNWELSTARATRLTRLFIDEHAFMPERMSAGGYAEFHPVASNASAEGRGENRRVDIIVLPKMYAAPTRDFHVPAAVKARTSEAASLTIPLR